MNPKKLSKVKHCDAGPKVVTTQKFHEGTFICISCGHATTIYINKDYSMFNIMEVNKTCSCCGLVKEVLSDGDSILRYDWPDPDTPPWQMQCASMRDEDRYCKDCRTAIPDNWKKMIVGCSKCNGEMESVSNN